VPCAGTASLLVAEVENDQRKWGAIADEVAGAAAR